MNPNQQSKTAILCFANSAQEEVKHKYLPKGRDLFNALTNNTLKTVEKTGLAYFHFTEKQQLGATFGERFSNAIQAIFEKGFQRVITVGNDTPLLKSQHIVEAVRQLESKNVVLGPSLDGGFYLLGIHKTHFNREQFIDLPWQTSSIKKTLLTLVRSYKDTQVALLANLGDIDAKEDVQRLFNFSSVLPREIVQLFIQILREFVKITTRSFLIVTDNKHFIYFNKGSPSC
ncbi:DUF2064 domain-containing protein [Cellulophaga sp. Hel_I_12]|uniref:TIGR04282 family arsenosugar biosynthesis glycosyltransferase n=1 Tax=Cellulophaga sp. Hel_I_12 TaxID=1249972 RepID=UPI000648FACB|nr:DUF2064 domain-containing protein [Cellulophaga sp. Hel_I_12]